jgi:molybdenum cofactor synthesis domain-containing protein
MTDKTAAIIIIGNEILSGKIPERNACYLIPELHKLGVAVRRMVVIPDDVEEISRTVRECASAFDYVLTSGGVGPTHDDLTIAGIGRAFNRPVVRNEALADLIRELFGRQADEARLRMADAPEGAHLIASEGLRWPVVAVENVFIFPGVPEILRNKFDAIRERFRATPFRNTSVLTLEDEFDLAPRLRRLAGANPEVEVGSYPTFACQEYRVRITLESRAPTSVDTALAQLLEMLDPQRLVRVE